MNETRPIIGFDVGLSGAYAIMTDDSTVTGVDDLPIMGEGAKRGIDAANLADVVRTANPRLAVVEQVNAMPGQGVSSMFRFGETKGVIFGVLAALGIPVMWVTPQKWKGSYGLAKDKEQARRLAIETWPSVAKSLGRKKDNGRAEALLIAEWGRKNAR